MSAQTGIHLWLPEVDSALAGVLPDWPAFVPICANQHQGDEIDIGAGDVECPV